MEDLDAVWEIQEYSPSKEGDNTNVRWILNKGLRLGKTVVITGIAISSIPLVLPPLVVMSALGLAFSVPFGLVFATYAFTEMLMSKLLPTPTSSLILDYYTVEDGVEEEDFGLVMEEEEEEQMEDTKQCVELRIVLDEGDYYGQKEEVVNNIEEEPTIRLGEKVKGEGFEEDVGESLEGEDEGIEVREESNQQKLVREGINSEDLLAAAPRVVILVGGDEKNNSNAGEVEELDSTAREVKGDTRNEEKVAENKEEIVRGNTGGLEKIGNKGNIGTAEENRMLESRNEESSVPYKVKRGGEAEGALLGKGNAKNVHNMGDLNGTVNDKSLGRNSDRMVQKQKPVVIHGRAKNYTITGVHEDINSKRKKKSLVHSNADAREIADESGFDLFDDKNAASNQNSYTAFDSLKAKDKKIDSTAEGNGDFLELPASVMVAESNYAESASETTNLVPSNEAFFSEKKTWEKIDAIRAIVGYKATPQPTCIGELKALYIFTGVEPPASFKDPSDSAEVNDKLHFLMSIVGVK